MDSDNLKPINEFFNSEITPEEFSDYLDEIYHQTVMYALTSGDNVSPDFVSGLNLMHGFSLKLKSCS